MLLSSLQKKLSFFEKRRREIFRIFIVSTYSQFYFTRKLIHNVDKKLTEVLIC